MARQLLLRRRPETEPAAPLHEASSDVKAGKSEVVPSGDDAVAYAVGQSLGEYIGKTNRQQEEAGMRLDSSIIIEGFSDGITGSRDRLAGTDKQKLLMDFDARLKAKAEEADKKKSAVEIARGEKFPLRRTPRRKASGPPNQASSTRSSSLRRTRMPRDRTRIQS